MAQPKGWHSRGDLPHFDSPETIRFITFRLADKLPPAISEAARHHENDVQRIDRELDIGLGACWLSRPEMASLVEDALLYFDDKRYSLLAWCLMPNHVHVIVEVRHGHSMSDIVRSWKSFTAHRANDLLGRTRSFWGADCFDRDMRNAEDLSRTTGYVERDPVKAGLLREPRGWAWSSARWRDIQ